MSPRSAVPLLVTSLAVCHRSTTLARIPGTPTEKVFPDPPYLPYDGLTQKLKQSSV